MRNTAERGTRERILEVAEASLGEYGYHGTRLHDIARGVGIQKASLFHYFPSKEQLYRTVVAEGLGHTEQTIRKVLEAEGDPLEKVRLLVEAYVDMVAAHPNRTKIFIRQSLGDAPPGDLAPDAEPVLNLVTTFVAQAQRAKVFAPIDPLALVLGVVGMAAFFFTSASVIAPKWEGDPLNPRGVEFVKRHVVEMVERCLTVGAPAHYSASKSAKASPPLPPSQDQPAR